MPPVTFHRTPSAAPSLRGGCRPFPYPTCPSGWTFGLSGDCIRTRHAATGLGQLQSLQPSLKGSRREILQGLGSEWVLRSDPPSIRFQKPLLLLFTWPPCFPSPWPFGTTHIPPLLPRIRWSGPHFPACPPPPQTSPQRGAPAPSTCALCLWAPGSGPGAGPGGPALQPRILSPKVRLPREGSWPRSGHWRVWEKPVPPYLQMLALSCSERGRGRI